jgi:sugar phosphate isomerase/epimerase
MRDEHLWIGEGTIDWDEAMGLLMTAPHTPALLLEITGDSQHEISAGASESFGKLERAMEEARRQTAER